MRFNWLFVFFRTSGSIALSKLFFKAQKFPFSAHSEKRKHTQKTAPWKLEVVFFLNLKFPPRKLYIKIFYYGSHRYSAIEPKQPENQYLVYTRHTHLNEQNEEEGIFLSKNYYYYHNHNCFFARRNPSELSQVRILEQLKVLKVHRARSLVLVDFQ